MSRCSSPACYRPHFRPCREFTVHELSIMLPLELRYIASPYQPLYPFSLVWQQYDLADSSHPFYILPAKMASYPASNSEKVTIVGAGLFGLTTALELARRGYKVLVLDRSLPPVPGGSSVDISRVIRPDYADDFYAKIGMEAMKGWETEYAPYFYRSGLLCLNQGLTHSFFNRRL
ncbi:unnamed protein product [Penicillium salamii]|uniref:FAD dependent oxidoreductase domain-containing protein n=1 Tax=Penicillium salamii TaxID=1612424 RepID=A0A9W4JT94_9EURO|nr:unnamed protein product [Penicillium salamii]